MGKRHFSCVKATAALFAMLLIAIPSAITASSRTNYPAWTFVRDSAGEVWLVTALGRVGVPILPISDAEINSIPFTGKWIDQSDQPDRYKLANSKPAWAAPPPSIAAAIPVTGPAPAPEPVTPAQPVSAAESVLPPQTEPIAEPLPELEPAVALSAGDGEVGGCFPLVMTFAMDTGQAADPASGVESVVSSCEHYMTDYGQRGYGCYEWVLSQLRRNDVRIARAGTLDAVSGLMSLCLQ